MPLLKTEDEREITKQADVLLEQIKFDKQLYQKDNTLQDTQDAYISDFLGQNCAPTAPEEHEQTFCEGKINESETAEALKEMKNGSAPGSNGLTTEFYKNFWPRIKCIVINSYKHLLEIGRWSLCTLYLY